MQRQHHYTAHSNSRAEHQIETQIRFFSFFFFLLLLFLLFFSGSSLTFRALLLAFVCCAARMVVVHECDLLIRYEFTFYFFYYYFLSSLWSNLVDCCKPEWTKDWSFVFCAFSIREARRRTHKWWIRAVRCVCVCEREGESGSNASRMPQISVISFQFFFMLLQYSVERTQFAGGSTNQCTAAANSLNDSTNKKQKKTQSDEFNNLQFSHVADNRIRMMVSLPAMFSIYTFFFSLSYKLLIFSLCPRMHITVSMCEY